MKSLPRYVFLLGFVSLISAPVFGQNLMKQRVERYLFSSYDMTKSGMKENERLMAILQAKLDQYVLGLSKEELAVLKGKEQEFNRFLAKLEAISEVKIMQQMIEDSKRSQKGFISSVVERGIKSLEEVQECQKAMAFLLMEKELLKMRNEKLVVLLKDDFSRTKFVDTVVASGKISEQTDTRNLMVTVDLSLSEYEI